MRRLLALVAAAALASAPYLAVPAAITTTVVVTGCTANAHTQVAQGRDLLTRVQRQLRKANEQGILADEVYVKTKPVQESARRRSPRPRCMPTSPTRSSGTCSSSTGCSPSLSCPWVTQEETHHEPTDHSASDFTGA